MTQEPIIAELALCIAELHDRVRRLQEENQDLVHQLGESDTRINDLLVDNQRLKAKLATIKPTPTPYEDMVTPRLSDKEALEELKRRMESTPYDDENSASRNAEVYGGQVMDELERNMTDPTPYEGTNSTDDIPCPGQCAEESVIDTSHGYTCQGHTAINTPEGTAFTPSRDCPRPLNYTRSEVVPSINPNATTAD